MTDYSNSTAWKNAEIHTGVGKGVVLSPELHHELSGVYDAPVFTPTDSNSNTNTDTFTSTSASTDTSTDKSTPVAESTPVDEVTYDNAGSSGVTIDNAGDPEVTIGDKTDGGKITYGNGNGDGAAVSDSQADKILQQAASSDQSSISFGNLNAMTADTEAQPTTADAVRSNFFGAVRVAHDAGELGGGIINRIIN